MSYSHFESSKKKDKFFLHIKECRMGKAMSRKIIQVSKRLNPQKKNGEPAYLYTLSKSDTMIIGDGWFIDDRIGLGWIG